MIYQPLWFKFFNFTINGFWVDIGFAKTKRFYFGWSEKQESEQFDKYCEWPIKRSRSFFQNKAFGLALVQTWVLMKKNKQNK